MRKIVSLVLLASLPSAAMADEDCWSSPFGAYGAPVMTWALVMNPPAVAKEDMLSTATAARKGLIIASQEYAITPVKRYLASDINLIDDKGKSLSKAVPLAAGSPITIWRGSGGEDRHCSIGWQNGLFGGATGEGHYRWICLEDSDKDGQYDNAWRPKSGNMGLSYSRLDMPLSPQIGWTETAPPPVAGAKNGGPLDTYPASRKIEVTGISGKSVQLWYWGAGIGRRKENRIELPIDKPGSASLGGITITVTPAGKGKAMLSASGAFLPQEVTPVCGGASYQIGEFNTQVAFSFPNW
jgi:hypothetical protein